MAMRQIDSRPTSRPLGLLTGAILAFGIALGLILLLILSNDNSVSAEGVMIVLLSGATLVAAIAVLWFGSRQKAFDSFEIIYPVTMLFVLQYPLRALFMLFFPTKTILPLNWPGDSNHYIVVALGIALVGMMCFWGGYFTGLFQHLARLLPRVEFVWTDQHLALKIVVLYVAGLVGLGILFFGGQILRFQWLDTRSSNPFYYILLVLNDFRLYAMLIIWAKTTKGWSPTLVIAIGMTLIEILIAIYAGNKQTIFMVLLIPLFVYHYVFKRQLGAGAILSGLLLGLFLFPVVQTYRTVYANTLGFIPNPSLNELNSISGPLLSELRQPADVWIANAVIYLGNRSSNLDSLVMVISSVPTVMDYQHGATLVTPLLTGLVPRFLWPNKPVFYLGSIMTSVIIGSPYLGNTPITDLGEFYLNFGVIGVPIGMFFWGIFYRVIFTYVQKNGEADVFRTISYFAIFPTLLFSGTGIAGTILAITRILLVILFIKWFLSQRAGMPVKASTHMAKAERS